MIDTLSRGSLNQVRIFLDPLQSAATDNVAESLGSLNFLVKNITVKIKQVSPGCQMLEILVLEQQQTQATMPMTKPRASKITAASPRYDNQSQPQACRSVVADFRAGGKTVG